MEKWKTILALMLMGLAIIFGWNWFWIILIVGGLVHTFMYDEIHFVEEIRRAENPVLYWIMIGFWTFFALYSIYGLL